MDSIEEVYQNLTNVDIHQQQVLWDERGKGYYGEYLVFKEIYPLLPGNCKILMNINIPVSSHKTTEIDLLLIHETGFYVFEVKHYKGTIYGKPDEPRWTQYFRTSANHAFRNPIEQNRYHIHALQSRYPHIPVHSFIVFTSSECDLKVECAEKDITLCRISALATHVRALSGRQKILDMEQLDVMFRDLMQFSPIMQRPVSADGSVMPFYEYAYVMSSQYKEEIDRHEEECLTSVRKIKKSCEEEVVRQEEKYRTSVEEIERTCRRKARSAIMAAVIVCLGSVATSFLVCRGHQAYCDAKVAQVETDSAKLVSAAQTELSEFARKFEHADTFENGDIKMEKDYITVSNLELSPSSEVENAVTFEFSLNCSGQYYCASINRDSTLIVLLTDGTVKEYTLPDDYFPYEFSKNLLLGKGNVYQGAYADFEFPIHHITGMDVEDIDHIKISSVDICVLNGAKTEIVASGYEIGIYDRTTAG